uniref:Uncharacterized protein n=1 Tax=Sciurus vulgaris TaxID=55149 RepID=A0A8D2AZG9_SCIVU
YIESLICRENCQWIVFCFSNIHLIFSLRDSKVILSGNLHCHFKSISQTFSRHYGEGDPEVKTLSHMPIVR